MKKWMYIRLFALGMLLGSASCTDEMVPQPDPGKPGAGEKEIPVKIDMIGLRLPDLSTYSTDYPGETLEDGSTSENALHDITIFIFNETFECEKIVYATSSPTDTVMVKTGKKHFVAIVNGEGKLTLPATPTAVDYDALKKTLTDAALALPTSPFLMTGEIQNVSLPDEVPYGNPYKIEMDVQRACAKVTLKVTKSGQAETHNITLQKIILHQGANQVALFTAPNPNSTNYVLTDTLETFDPVNGVVPNKSTGTYCALADSFYTYESLCGPNKSKAVWIEIESAVNSPTNIRTAKFYLGETSTTPGDTTYNIYRNYWYDVAVNIVKPGMDSLYVTVNVTKWNEAPTQTEEPGGGFELTTSTPFRLVKNYTLSDLQAGNNGAFAAIAEHTQGEAYVDLKVTEDVSWNLNFKSATGENANAKMALGADSADWTTDWVPSLTGTGDGNTHRIWIYRPYVENAEPASGPTLTLTVGGVEVRDLVVQPRTVVPAPTNCYILRPQLSGVPANETHAYIPLAGVYRFWEDEVLSNGQALPAGPVTAELLWKDRTGDVIKNISVINANNPGQAYIYAEAGSIPGNAVVAMKVAGEVYWSFHLWVTEYNPYEAAGQKWYTGATDNIFMDRNLGALTNVYDAAGEARGLYYQFGRKDPFPRTSGWNSGAGYQWFDASNVPSGAISGATLTHSYTALRPRSGFEAYLENPTRYYTNVTVDGQVWPLYTENNYLWDTEGGNKTAFDPCPEGWRIPTQDASGMSASPWAGLLTTNFLLDLPGYENGLYHDRAGYYPAYGYIMPSSSPACNASLSSYYWTSWKGIDGKAGIALKTLDVTPQDMYMDNALSVRCVVDVNYLIQTEGGGLFENGDMVQELIP